MEIYLHYLQNIYKKYLNFFYKKENCLYPFFSLFHLSFCAPPVCSMVYRAVFFFFRVKILDLRRFEHSLTDS